MELFSIFKKIFFLLLVPANFLLVPPTEFFQHVLVVVLKPAKIRISNRITKNVYEIVDLVASVRMAP